MAESLFAVKVGAVVVETDLSHADARALALVTDGARIVPVGIVAADAAAGAMALDAAGLLDGIDVSALEFAHPPAFVAAAERVRSFDRLPASKKPAAVVDAIRAILMVERLRPQTISNKGKVTLGSLAACMRWLETATGTQLGYEYPDGVADFPTVGQMRFVVALAGWLQDKPRVPGEAELNLKAISEYIRSNR